MEDWGTKSMQLMSEERVLASASFASVAAKVGQKLFTRAPLNTMINMVTEVQFLVHTPLLNI